MIIDTLVICTMISSLVNLRHLFHSFSNSNLNISPTKHLYISIFSFASSSQANCYNSPFHQLDHFNKYQKLLLQRKMSTTENSSVEFIKPSELAQVIKDTSQTPGKDYLVVDVRDTDYEVNFIFIN